MDTEKNISKVQKNAIAHSQMSVDVSEPLQTQRQIDVYLRASHSAFQGRIWIGVISVVLIFFASLMVYQWWSGVENGIRHATNLQTLEKYRNAGERNYRALFDVFEAKLRLEQVLRQEASNEEQIKQVANVLMCVSVTEYPNDILEVFNFAVENVSALQKPLNTPQLQALINLLAVLEDKLRAMNTSEAVSKVTQWLVSTRRTMILRASGDIRGDGQNLWDLMNMLDAKCLSKDQLLVKLHDAKEILDRVDALLGLLASDESLQSVIGDITLTAAAEGVHITMNDCLLGESHSSEEKEILEKFPDLKCLGDYKCAILDSQGVDAIRALYEITTKEQENIGHYARDRFSEMAEQRRFSKFKTLEQSDYAALQDCRNWVKTDECMQEAAKKSTNLDEFLKNFVEHTDPNNREARRLQLLGEGIVEAFTCPNLNDDDLSSRIEELRNEYDSLKPSDKEDVGFRWRLLNEVYYPVAIWAGDKTQRPNRTDLLVKASASLLELIGEMAKLSKVNTVDRLGPRNHSLWSVLRISEQKTLFEGLKIELSKDIEKLEDVTEEYTATIDDSELGNVDNFVLLQEVALGLWLAENLDLCSNEKAESLKKALQSPRLKELPNQSRTGSLSGIDAMKLVLFRAIPLPLDPKTHSTWWKRRCKEGGLLYQKPCLFSRFVFADDFSCAASLLEQLGAVPVLHWRFFDALEVLRNDIMNSQSLDTMDDYPHNTDLQAHLKRMEETGVESVIGMVALVRSEAILQACALSHHSLDKSIRVVAALNGAQRNSFEEKVKCKWIGGSDGPKDLLSKCSLDPELYVYESNIFEKAPMSFVETAKAALACWGYLGLRYGENGVFDQRWGDDKYQIIFDENKGVLPSIFTEYEGNNK
jgi:hypothetical protein